MKQLFLVLFVVFGLAGNALALDCSDSVLRFPMSEITRMVQINPNAADTLEGVHLYWIRWQDYPEAIQVTELALSCLESQGVMEQFHVANRVLWRRAR
ncbi:hypothetical protein ACNQKP_15095 [Bdellovibrio bacteriovorus]|uniref:hypothetical protein n=1 Tax=Bdellovibrio bacteriovorus TaxID=959 RepID=UPI003AA9A164